MYKTLDFEMAALHRYNLYILSESTAKKFKVMKIRMKINLMSFLKNMTVKELFLKAIYDCYYQRKNLGLIKNPWPHVKKVEILKILLGDNYDKEEEQM